MNSLFRGRWLLPTLGVILLTIIFLLLGVWQLERRSQRLAANARVLERLQQPPLELTAQRLAAAPLDTDQADLRRATIRGVFDYDQEIVLRNRSWNEQPGVHVLVPLKIDGTTSAVLVDRGWIPYEDAAPADRAQFHNASGDVEVYGILRQAEVKRGLISPEDRTPTLTERVDNWHRVDLAKIQQQVPYTLLPLFVEEDVLPNARPRQYPKPQPDISLDEGPHLSYAIQWFFFAVVASSGYVAFYRQRARPGATRAVSGERSSHKPSLRKPT